MKKTVTITAVLFLIIFILTNSFEIMESIRLSFSICINNLFPSLIPFMILSNILINYDLVYDISSIFEKLMTKIFKVNKNCAFAFVMSILSGTPSNSKYLKDLKEHNLITTNDCQKCLNFCHFTNPIFILGTIGYTFLKNKKLGLIILISQYSSSIIIGIIFRNVVNNINDIKIEKKQNKKKFLEIINSSIISVFNTLLLILGIITICLILSCILNKILNLNENIKFLYGLIEITQGLNYLSNSNLTSELKTIISSAMISFGGLCIHLQVYSILDNNKIRYLPYLLSRIIHSVISTIITFLLISIKF